MDIRVLRLTPALGPIVAALVMGSAAVSNAQTPSANSPVRQGASASHGQPEIQGYWLPQGIATGAVVEGGSDAALAGKPSATYKNPIVDPANGRIPWQPWAAARYEELRKNVAVPELQYIDPVARCLPAGVPRVMYVTPYNGYQIIQTRGYVVLIAEWNHSYRIIPIDGKPHLPAELKLWMGDSRGRWEGNTLIVDTTNTNGKAWFQIVGGFVSEGVRLTERLTLVDAKTLRYEVTIDDPKVFTQPWTMVGRFTSATATTTQTTAALAITGAFPDVPQLNYELYEYACHEGNRPMEAMLGSRAAKPVTAPGPLTR